MGEPFQITTYLSETYGILVPSKLQLRAKRMPRRNELRQKALGYRTTKQVEMGNHTSRSIPFVAARHIPSISVSHLHV